jgi:hypothetical protein
VKEETSAAAAIEKLNTTELDSIENMICGGSAAKGGCGHTQDPRIGGSDRYIHV